jgi:hypothetical protein
MANSTGITVLIKLFHKYERAWGQGSKLPVSWWQPRQLGDFWAYANRATFDNNLIQYEKSFVQGDNFFFTIAQLLNTTTVKAPQ